MPDLDFILAYEGGELSEEEIIAGFQKLIDSGAAWQFQGHYGRTATALIKAGRCTDKSKKAPAVYQKYDITQTSSGCHVARLQVPNDARNCFFYDTPLWNAETGFVGLHTVNEFTLTPVGAPGPRDLQ